MNNGFECEGGLSQSLNQMDAAERCVRLRRGEPCKCCFWVPRSP